MLHLSTCMLETSNRAEVSLFSFFLSSHHATPCEINAIRHVVLSDIFDSFSSCLSYVLLSLYEGFDRLLAGFDFFSQVVHFIVGPTSGAAATRIRSVVLMECFFRMAFD